MSVFRAESVRRVLKKVATLGQQERKMYFFGTPRRSILPTVRRALEIPCLKIHILSSWNGYACHASFIVVVTAAVATTIAATAAAVARAFISRTLCARSASGLCMCFSARCSCALNAGWHFLLSSHSLGSVARLPLAHRSSLILSCS